MKHVKDISLVFISCMLLSCSHLREVSIYEYSKSVSAFDKFAFKELFVS